jgi:hypothetical protein
MSGDGKAAAAVVAAPKQSQSRLKRRKGAAAALSALEAVEFVTKRAAANGPERVNLKGATLEGPAAVAAVCACVLALGGGPTTTLNLVSSRPRVRDSSQARCIWLSATTHRAGTAIRVLTTPPKFSPHSGVPTSIS